jgi:putative ABC transport system substrate-binding protein
LLRELLPIAARFGVLDDPPVSQSIADRQAAARALGLQLVIVNARTDSDLESAFANFSQQRVGAVVVGLSSFYNQRKEQLAALAARHALPASYFTHQAGIYTGRILKGEKPADLPVEQATKIELTLNLKTAKALGLTIPETLLATADEVIQ